MAKTKTIVSYVFLICVMAFIKDDRTSTCVAEAVKMKGTLLFTFKDGSMVLLWQCKPMSDCTKRAI